MYCLIHMSEGKFTFTLYKANIPPNLLLLHWCLTSWEMVMWGKSNIFSEEPALKTFKWGNTFRFIFQVQFLECLSDESSNQKQRAGLSNSAEVTALGSLQSCVPVESWGISLVSQPSTAHSLLIYQSLSLLLGSANYSWAPATAACLIWRCAGWLWCLYQHERAGDRVLIEQKGIMRLPAPGGGTIFKIYMFNSYFILLSGDFGPSFSQGLATFCTAITATCLLILLPFHLGNHTSLQGEQARLPEASHTSLLGWQPFLPLLISYGERLY